MITKKEVLDVARLLDLRPDIVEKDYVCVYHSWLGEGAIFYKDSKRDKSEQ